MANKRGKIFVAPDQMSAVLRAVVGEPSALSSLNEVKDELNRLGVTYGIDLDLVETWFSSEDNDELVVAKGKYSKNGRDGFVKFLVDVSAKPQFVPAEDGKEKNIDYRSAMRVSLVQADQKMAEIVAPTAGDPGTNIMGGIMAAAPGNATRIGVGDNVEQVGNDIIAKSAGTPNYRENVLSVRKMYEVGNVSFETGNINFPGTVVIKGDVLDDFEIQAQEHVIIQGLVNAARITAGGYIQCLGGIFGKGKAELRANGFIEARFCDSASLCSDGDITITKDLLHCKTQCLGQVKCGGAVIGGEVLALKGVEAADIGSEMGSKTIVGIRKHYRQEKAKEMVGDLLAEANEILEYYKRWTQLPQMEPADLEALERSIKSLAGIIQKKKTLDLQIDKFERLVGETKNAVIRVHKNLWADVVLSAPYCKYSPLESTSGPLSVIEDVAHGSMAVHRG